MRGFFITFEGIDGAGKTTQQHLAAQALREQGYDVLESREPGGTQLAEKVRALVLDPELPLTTATQTLLYLGSTQRACRQAAASCAGSRQDYHL